MSATQRIPCLSLAESDTKAFCDSLYLAFAEYGFVALADHGLRAGLRARVLEELNRFFEAPLERKMTCHRAGTGGARGYTPFGIEAAKDQTIPDLKEFYHVGRTQVCLRTGQSEPNSRQLRALASLPENVWPGNMDDFQRVLVEMYDALESIGARVLRAIAASLGQPADYFEAVTDVGNSLLRALHYPPIASDHGGAVRAAAHEDINLITLLVGSEEPGLEVQTRTGEWIAAPGGDDLIICNVGDMLERLTNHVLVSTTHRVVNPQPPWCYRSRYSLPFFLHPNSDFLIRSLSSCVSEGNPDRYPEPILADDFLHQRLVEIGLV